MSDESLPQSDQIDGAPHPRETLQLFGQDAAQQGFLEVFNAGRLHHGWLLTGPRGIGKATLAWQISRFLIATPKEDDAGLFGAPPKPTSLAIDLEHPVARRIQAGSEPGLVTINRPYDEKTKKFKAQITVDEVRRLKNFFALSAADGGHRVVIVDAADDMNTSAANALLKLLEEPPADTTLLLISHQPSRLLPTIRSRCRELRLAPLSPSDMAAALEQADPGEVAPPELAELSGGSVGEAIRLAHSGGPALYAQLVALFAGMPRPDRQAAMTIAEYAAQPGQSDRLDHILNLIDLFLLRLVRAGATGQPPLVEAAPNEANVLAQLARAPAHARAWADVAQEISARSRHGKSVNLDPAALVLDTVWKIQNTAQRLT